MPSALHVICAVFCSANASSEDESEIPDCQYCTKKHAAAVVFMAGTVAFFLQDFARTFLPLCAPKELIEKVYLLYELFWGTQREERP